ncbi:hypothetical protein [Streptomyces sp. NPDC002402]
MSTPPPNPYTQPQYPQNPQYPQQTQYPQNPQGYGGPPPGPYQQQPYPGAGGPGGWGGLPMAPPVPPPKKDRTVMVLSIVVASIAALAAVAWLVNNVIRPAGERATGAGFPKAEYRLTLPPTLLHGKYKLADDQSDKHQGALAGTSEANIRDPRGSVAQYVSASESGVLVISGLHGRIKDPELARTKLLAGAGQADGSSIVVPAADFTPAGSDVPVSCQVVVTQQTTGGKTTLPMCAWADGNTSASVAIVTPETAKQSPQEVDLKAMAEATVKVRRETRQPIG